MKKVAIVIIVVAVLIAVHGLFFEFCVSRECPQFITMIAGVILIIADVFCIFNFYKLTESVLSVDADQKPKNENEQTTESKTQE